MLNLVRCWILLSTLLVSAGWILSALHQLNRGGYAVVLALAGSAAIFWQRKTRWQPQKTPAQLRRKFKKRFRRPAPRLFLALALMSLLAGLWHLPTNMDADCYRLPRVLHWLGAEQWHWIHTYDFRMNVAASGFEWLSAPLILFTHTDQFLFLINWVSFLMLPGLLFSVFTRLDVRPRVAWWWMWLLSGGWCYATQAGSVANDSFAAVYALAAVDLALRARQKKCDGDLWLSLLAVALLTGAKQTNLPLVLLWLIAVFPNWKRLFRRPAAATAVVAAGLLVSAAPAMLANLKYAGDWVGFPHDLDSAFTMTLLKTKPLDSPLWGIVGNAICLTAQNLMPPFFPWADAWNGAMQRMAQTPFGGHFAAFEVFGWLSSGVSETNAGIGLGICLLALVSWGTAGRYATDAGNCPRRFDWQIRLLQLVPWALLLVFMAKVGTFQNARLLAPYYPFLILPLLAGAGQAGLTRKRWWQGLGRLTMLLTAALLFFLPNRPLFPAQRMLASLQSRWPDSKIRARVANLYHYQQELEDQRSRLQRELPANMPVIGYATGIGRCEPALWLPFGQRRVERVLPQDTPEQLRGKGIRYMVIEDTGFEMAHKTPEQWLADYDAELATKIIFEKDPLHPAIRSFYLVHLR